MKIAAYLTALCLCASSSSFAEEPQPPAAQADSAAAAVAAAPATAADAKPVAPTVADKAAADKAALDAEIKKMRGRGYKPLVRNGQQLYCRSEGEIGSHFERTRCNTMDELKQAELNGKDYVKSIQQQGSPTEFKGDMPGSPTH
jgi:uncharacterized membrane-anchored protein